MILRIFALFLLFTSLDLIAIAGSNSGKRSGSGIFDLLPGDTVQKPVENLQGKSCWSNPNIAGVVVRGTWGKFEPAANQYDWSYFDTGVSLAQAHNKKVSISVHAGVDSPPWIYGLGAKPLKVPGYGTMPLPWDPVFKQYWAHFVQALGARYDGVSVVAYITMGGPGRLEEDYLCTTLASVHNFNADGGVSAWTTAAETITDLYATAFPSTPFLYAYGSPASQPKSSIPFSDVTSYAAKAYSGRYGIKSDALHPNMSPSFWPNIEIPVLSSSTTVGYQMLKAFAGGTVDGGTLKHALDFGVSSKAHFIEVYDRDCNDPNEQSVISAVNQQLLSDYP